MTELNIVGQGADATRHCMITNENASGGTEARKHNHFNETVDRKDDRRSGFKRSLFARTTVDADVLDELIVLPADTPTEDLEQELCPDAAIDLPANPVAPISRYKLLTDDDLRKLPPVQWRIKDVLPSHGIAVMFGPSGSGKSFLVLDMLQSLAFGRDWFGHKVMQCSVTYIALEGEAGVAGRIKAYQSRHGSTSLDIRYVAQPFKLLEADDINELAEAILAAGTGDVVVLDTLSRATPGLDENDSKAMGLIIASAKILQDLIGGLVMLIHHTGKDASKGMRGHSSLHAALDCAIEVKRSGDRREWLVAKSKDGEDGASHSFTLDVVTLGLDSDGDEITSCVIVPNQSVQAVAKKMPTLGSNQVIALKALEEPLCKSVDIDKDGAPLGRPGIRFDDAIAMVTPLMPVEAKHQKERAKEAIKGLVRNGVLSEKEEWLSHNQSPQH